MIKAFAFDLDGTLTQHKTPLDDTNRAVLEKLNEKYTLLMVGAGNSMRIHKQLGGFPIDVIGNYGMQYAKFENGELRIIRDDAVTGADKNIIEEKVTSLRKKHGFESFRGENVEYHASGCVTFPILGTKALQDDKLKFDPTRKIRRAFYGEVCELFSDYNVFVGGSSSFDMAPKPYNKYYALDLWCRENGFEHSEVIFVGDDYGLGGNDESVYESDFRFLTIDDYRRLPEILAPWISEDVTDVDGLLGEKCDCECSSIHTCKMDKVVIRRGALNELPALAKKYNNIVLVCDENTRAACANTALELLSGKIEACVTFPGAPLLVPNEAAVEKIKSQVSEKTDLIIGVGSGVINDLSKYVSFEFKLPYFIVATAPSMDGYASKGAAMIFDGMKVTTNAAVPRAIIADTEVLKNAPLEMLKAGYGDIIGKFSCLNDWRLGALINGEPLCNYIYNLTYKTAESVSKMGRAILSRDEESIASLMRSLVIVGIAMAYMGNSRPASGSEHHLSHFFEIVGLLRGEPYFCHGTDVAYSAFITAKLREKLLNIDSPKAKAFNEGEWEEAIKRVYASKNGETEAGIIAMQKKLGFIYEDKFPVYLEKWEEIKAVLEDSPTPEEFKEMLDSIELSLDDFYKTYSKEKINEAVLYGKDLKDRYSVLWLYNSLI